MPKEPKVLIKVYMRCETCPWVMSAKSYTRYSIGWAKDHVECYPDHEVAITTRITGVK